MDVSRRKMRFFLVDGNSATIRMSKEAGRYFICTKPAHSEYSLGAAFKGKGVVGLAS